MCVHVCMYVEVGEYHPWVSSQGHCSLSFKTRSLRGLDVTTEVRLTGQKALGILSPQLQLWDYKHKTNRSTIFAYMPGTQLSPAAYPASTLPTEPSLQPDSYHLTSNVVRLNAIRAQCYHFIL